MSMKYVMTPSHPDYENREVNISAYCELTGSVFNQFNERVFAVVWYTEKGERLFEGKCFPHHIRPMHQREDLNMLYTKLYAFDEPKESKGKYLDIWGKEKQ